MKNSLQWRHLQEEGKFMARPQHSPTPSSTQAPATPFESRTRTKPEEKHLCRRWTKKIPKKDPQVLLQAGRIKPISDRSPQVAIFAFAEKCQNVLLTTFDREFTPEK